VSYQLAGKLGLKNIRFLLNSKENQSKLVVFAPKADVEKISESIFASGGGNIGEYSDCSFRTNGTGTFTGSKLSNPKIGAAKHFTEVDEVRLEFVIDSWKLSRAIKNMLKVHPYEEPAFDIYPLNNSNKIMAPVR